MLPGAQIGNFGAPGSQALAAPGPFVALSPRFISAVSQAGAGRQEAYTFFRTRVLSRISAVLTFWRSAFLFVCVWFNKEKTLALALQNETL